MSVNKVFFALFFVAFFVVGGLFTYSSVGVKEYSVKLYLDKDADPFQIIPEVGVVQTVRKIDDAPNAYEFVIKSKESPTNIISRIKKHKKVREILFSPLKFD